MKLRVCSDALVMPRRIGSPCCRTSAACDRLVVGGVELGLVHVFTLQQRGVAAVLDLPFLEHLADDDLDVLVVDLHALKSIDVLHLVDHVVCQRLDTHDGKDVMRRGVAVHDVVALLDEVAFLHRDVLALGHHVFHRLHRLVRRVDRDAALVLVVLAEFHVAVDFGDDRVVLGTTGLEQFRHPRQTAGDVLGLGAFARDPRDDVTGLDVRSVLDRQDGVDRHRVGHRIARVVAHRLSVLAHQDQFGLEIVALGRRAPVGHDLLGHARRIVGLVADGDARDQVDELHRTRLLGDDRQGVGIPLEQLVATG